MSSGSLGGREDHRALRIPYEMLREMYHMRSSTLGHVCTHRAKMREETMPLTMNREVFITCAVTGAGDTVGRSDKVPVTPQQIADAAIEAAKAGAAIAHIHVRDPATGKGARDPKLYREVVERIRSSGTDVVINLTAGMGGDLMLGSAEAAAAARAGRAPTWPAPTERLAHVAELLPEICTLDCGTMNFGEGDYVMTNTPAMLKAMAGQITGARRAPRDRDLRHRPSRARQMAGRAGADRRPGAGAALHGHSLGRAGRHRHASWRWSTTCPQGWIFSAFSIGRNQLPYAALAVLAGGNVRVGLEDNLWLGKGQLATNGAAGRARRDDRRRTWARACSARTRCGRS